MSRIGKKLINIPSSVKVDLQETRINVSGPLGSLEVEMLDGLSVEVEGNNCSVINNSAKSSFWGTLSANLKNAIEGVSSGFSKTINLVGVGYKAVKTGNGIQLNLGYSHPIDFEVDSKVSFDLPSQTKIIFKSYDKTLLGEVCSKVKKMRKVEPYKGKGVHLEGDFVLRKEGKNK